MAVGSGRVRGVRKLMRAEDRKLRPKGVFETIHAWGGAHIHWSCSDEVYGGRKCVRSHCGGQGEKAHEGCRACVCAREPGDSHLKFCFLQVRRLILPP